MTLLGKTDFLPLPPRSDCKEKNWKWLHWNIPQKNIEWFEFYSKINSFTLAYYLQTTQNVSPATDITIGLFISSDLVFYV